MLFSTNLGGLFYLYHFFGGGRGVHVQLTNFWMFRVDTFPNNSFLRGGQTCSLMDQKVIAYYYRMVISIFGLCINLVGKQVPQALLG